MHCFSCFQSKSTFSKDVPPYLHAVKEDITTSQIALKSAVIIYPADKTLFQLCHSTIVLDIYIKMFQKMTFSATDGAEHDV